MASFSACINVKFDEGTTFIFGSWICTANQDGKLHPPPPAQVTPRGSRKTPNSDTIFGSYPTRRSTWCPKQTQARANNNNDPAPIKQQVQPTRPRLHGGLQITSDRDNNSMGSQELQSKFPSRTPQFPFGLTNLAAIYQTHLMKKLHQTRQANSDLVMTATPSGVIVYWPDMDPVHALQQVNDPSKVQGTFPLLPFQEGRELSVISDNEQPGPNNPARQFCATIRDDSDDEVVSDDTPTVDGETQADRELRIERNRSRALRRRHIRMKNLNNEFDNEGIFKSPAANIMFVVSVLEGFQATPNISIAKAHRSRTHLAYRSPAPNPSRHFSRSPSLPSRGPL
nr:unnamed protein product [Digitaria exilis]